LLAAVVFTPTLGGTAEAVVVAGFKTFSIIPLCSTTGLCSCLACVCSGVGFVVEEVVEVVEFGGLFKFSLDVDEGRGNWLVTDGLLLILGVAVRNSTGGSYIESALVSNGIG
jgi:hypothetical protein